MKKNIQSIRGMHDILPTNIIFWHKVEKKIKKILFNYGFNEIRTPIIEKKILFSTSIGNSSDIIEKEMYFFKDKNNEIVALRPENTSGCVRAGIQNGILHNSNQKLWYIGQMFRRERPQKGRYRQFYQLGAEAFGIKNPSIDAEIIAMTARMWKEFGIIDNLILEINSIGSLEARLKYKKILTSFFESKINETNKDYIKHMLKNPLKMLDSKNKNIQKILNDAPSFFDFIDEPSKKHFSKLCKFLKKIKIKYKINQKLMRGLNYYNSTIFEWKTNTPGFQTICAGGRYDNLVKNLGGKQTAAIGFAIGLERLILLIQQTNKAFFKDTNKTDVCIISYKDIDQKKILELSESIRNQISNLKLIINHNEENIKTQFKKANKNNTKIAIILNKNEFNKNQITLKDLKSKKQKKISKNEIKKYLNKLLK